jgi:hypothetical protein
MNFVTSLEVYDVMSDEWNISSTMRKKAAIQNLAEQRHVKLNNLISTLLQLLQII